MSATLGTYSIDLIAKIAQFESDLGRAARIAEQQGQAIQRSIQHAADSASDAFKDLAGKVIAAFSVEKLIEFGNASIELGDKLEKMSQKIGIGVENLSALRAQAQLSDVGFEDLGGALEKLARSAGAAADGTSKQADAYRAIGVAVKDATGNLRPMDDILADVAKKMASYQDGTAKTALAQDLFGRSGAQLIPLLNDLGTKGFAVVRKEAEAYNQVIGEEQAKNSEVFHDNLTKLSQAASGFANAVIKDLLPGMVQLSNQFAQTAKTSDGYASSASTVATAIKGMVFGIIVAKEVVSGFVTAVISVFDAVNTVFDASGKVIKAFAESAAEYFKTALNPFSTSAQIDAVTDKFIAKIKTIGTEVKTSMAGVSAGLSGGLTNAVQNATASFNSLFGTFSDVSAGATTVSNNVKKIPAPLVESSKAAQKVAGDLLEMQKILDNLAGKLGGPYDKAWNEYKSAIDEANKAAAKFTADGVPLAEVQKFVADATELAVERFRNLTDETYVLDNAMNKIDATVAHHMDLVTKTGHELAVETEYEKLLNDVLKSLDSVMGPLTEKEQKRIEGLHATAEALVTLDEEQKQSQALLKDWASQAASQFDSAFSTINKDILEGGNVMKDLVNIAKQVVEAILLQFEKLAIINPILNSVFRSATGSLLPTLETAGGALGQSGGLLGNLGSLLGLGGGGLASSGAIAGGGTYNLVGVGSQGIVSDTISSLGGVAGITSIVGGALGGFELGKAITGSNAGGAAGAIGIAAAAYFIPVIGWIAGAAALINQFTGGGLFGTSYKPYGSELNIGVSDTGSSVTALLDEKKKKALFGGTSYRTVSTPVDQQTQDAVASFYKSLQDAATQEAAAFGETTGTIVTGTFHETFDKAGKMLTEVSTVAGQQYKESIQDFQTRILADTLLANMGDASAEAQKIAEQWQKSASDLLAGAEFLSQAQLDIIHGSALAQGDTLTQLTAFVQGMGAQGESLIQTYVRLSAEVTDVQNILTGLGLDTGKTGEALVKFDDAMVKAAGGLDNLNKLWNDYYQNFYSDSERAAIKLQNDQATARSLLQGIGQDPNETMAQFRQNFAAMLSTLSPEDVVKWLQAGEALAALNADLGNTAQAAADAAKAQQDQAQALYDSAQKAADGLKSLIASTQQLAAQLFGSLSQQLQSQLDVFKGTDLYQFEAVILQPQIDAAKQQEAAAKSIGDASTLLNDFAQIGVVSGQSLEELAKQFHVPLDQLAKMLGTDSGGLAKQFAADEALAAASLNIDNNTKLSAEYLADIKALLEGKAAPYSVQDFLNAESGANVAAPGGKPGRSGVTGPTSADVATAVHVSSQNSTDVLAAHLRNIESALRELGARVGSVPPSDARTYRTTVFRQP